MSHNLKYADLYYISKKLRVINGDRLSFFRANIEPTYRAENSLDYVNSTAEIIDVPVHKIFVGGRVSFIAIEPEIKEILEKPLLDDIEYLKRCNQSLIKNSGELYTRLSGFNDMTKWQKIKFILKGGWV